MADFIAGIERLRVKYPLVPVTAAEVIYVQPPTTWPPSATEHNQGFMEWLHWHRWREPLWQSVQKSEKGDLAAYGRHERTARDYQSARFGRGAPKPSKSKQDHLALFGIGIGLGLEHLKPAELACCFDFFCPCGKFHNGEALVKQRARAERDIREAFEWEAAARKRAETGAEKP